MLRFLQIAVALGITLVTTETLSPAKRHGDDEATLIGQPAPAFSLSNSKGSPVNLSDYKGKVVLVNFWATWCHGCQLEIPWFIGFQRKYKADGLAVIGISLDDDGWKSVNPWIAEKKVNYAIVIGTGDLAKKYGLGEGMPLTVLIGRDGKIAASYSGVVDKTKCEAEISSLLRARTRNSAD